MTPPCQICGALAPTAHVTLYRNIGMLVARQLTTTQGQMCRRCARDKWLSETLLTSFLGWWGIISFFVNIFAVLNNLAQAPKVFSIPADASGLQPDGTVKTPNTGKIMLGIFGGLAALFVAFIALGVWASGANKRRIAEIEKRVATARAQEKLDQATACDLTEIQLLQGLRDSHSVGDFKCKGPLEADGAKAALAGVTANSGDEAFNVCLKKGPKRWFVAGVGGCIDGELESNPALAIDAQEDEWRKTEAKNRLAQARVGLDAKLLAIKTAIDGDRSEDEEDEDEVPAAKLPPCSSETLKGVEKPSLYDIQSIDAALLGKEHKGRGDGWSFLTSYEVKDAFGEGYGSTDSQLRSIERLEKTHLVAIVGEHAMAALPELKGSKSFEGGMFLGHIYLADLSKGQTICSRMLAFQSSKDLWISTSKYTSETSKESQFRTKLNTDFESRFSTALRDAVQNSWRSEAQVLEDEKKMMLDLLGSDLGAGEDDEYADEAAPPGKPVAYQPPAKSKGAAAAAPAAKPKAKPAKH